MRSSSRFALVASCVGVAAIVGGCTTRTVELATPTVATVRVPVATAPAVAVTPVASMEYGRITNIEYFPNGTASTRLSVPGALVGSVAGSATIAREPTTVLGGAAAVTPSGVVNTPYRITVQTDQGVFRTYDVPGTGDLHIGDRVRIENSVIYHF